MLLVVAWSPENVPRMRFLIYRNYLLSEYKLSIIEISAEIGYRPLGGFLYYIYTHLFSFSSGWCVVRAISLLYLLSFSLMNVCRISQYHLLRTPIREYLKTKSQASLAKGSEEEVTLLLAETKV